MTNKFFLIRVSLAEGTREVTDMSDGQAAEKIAEFAAMLFSANTNGPMKPMSAGHVLDDKYEPNDVGLCIVPLKGALQK